MAVVPIVHEDGRTATVPAKRVPVLREQGWKPASEIPTKPAKRVKSAVAIPAPVPPAPEATPEPEEQQ